MVLSLYQYGNQKVVLLERKKNNLIIDTNSFQKIFIHDYFSDISLYLGSYAIRLTKIPMKLFI